jgi:hypothetical protein
VPTEKEPQCKQKQVFAIIFAFMVLFLFGCFFCGIRVLFDDERSVSDALKTEEKKVLDFSLGTFRLWFGLA